MRHLPPTFLSVGASPKALVTSTESKVPKWHRVENAGFNMLYIGSFRKGRHYVLF